jgi:alkaline phosphatase
MIWNVTGMVGGVISTSRVTHATPAAAYAYSAEREWEADVDMPIDASACSDLAAQLVREDRWGRGGEGI